VRVSKRTLALAAALAVLAPVLAAALLLLRQVPAARGNPEHGRDIFLQRGCTSCHTIRAIGIEQAWWSHMIALDLSRVATVAATREPGMSAEAYIRESIADPAAYTVPGSMATMPPNLASGDDLDDVVAFLLQQQ
jgi:mono/diheme cytochrome c family protein